MTEEDKLDLHLREAIDSFKRNIVYETAKVSHGKIDAEVLRDTRCCICMELITSSCSMIPEDDNPYMSQFHTDCGYLVFSRSAYVAAWNLVPAAPWYCRKWLEKRAGKAYQDFRKLHAEYCQKRGIEP